MFRIVAAFGLSLWGMLVLCPLASSETFTAPPIDSLPYTVDAATVVSSPGTSTSCCTCSCGSGHHRHGPVQMPPHYPYFPPMHGYYYFRPYNHIHLQKHRAIVAGWGGDIQAPYANEIFQQVYDQHESGMK